MIIEIKDWKNKIIKMEKNISKRTKEILMLNNTLINLMDICKNIYGNMLTKLMVEYKLFLIN
jgi:hypothetical protein